MLSRLEIEGLAIIDALTIEFSPQFNVITGETGAGKSILIRALGLLLGAKGSPEAVRSGRLSASVTGFFEVGASHRVYAVLERYGIPTGKVELEARPLAESEGDCVVLIRRVVTLKGKFLAWINNTPVTAMVLKEVGGSLIDVFGQHDSLRLLDPAHHLQWVDEFLSFVKVEPLARSLPTPAERATGKDILTEYLALRKKISHNFKDLSEMVGQFRTRRQRADYLQFRCEELRRFQPNEEEFLHISTKLKKASQDLQTLRDLELVQQSLDGGEGGRSPSQSLWDCHRRLQRFSSHLSELALPPQLLTCADQALQIASQIDDLSFQIGVITQSLGVNESELEEFQTRLVGYQELFRKLGVSTIDQLLVEQQRLFQDLEWLDQAEHAVRDKLLGIEQQIKTLYALGQSLTKARFQAKTMVQARLEHELHALAMPGTRIDVELTPIRAVGAEMDVSFLSPEIQQIWFELAKSWAHLGEHGMEKGQFLLAANPGEPLHPLQKIASGGEISRVILALKTALSAGADSCILVFDEIDTGISGRVADVVGRKIQELSRRFQVICISHLAQVTAYGDAHFLVKKLGSGDRTQSQIIPLHGKESEHEIARLISGAEVTPASLKHSRTLLKKAQSGRLGQPSLPAEAIPEGPTKKARGTTRAKKAGKNELSS